MRKWLHWISPSILLVAWFAVIGFSMVNASVPSSSLRFGINPGTSIVAPIETEVCPGDVIHYPTLTFVEEGSRSQASVAEAWCKAGLEGGCIAVVRPDMPLLEPKNIVNPATPRTVLETLAPGIWHMQHSATDELGRVSAYIVAPINVKDCQVKP